MPDLLLIKPRSDYRLQYTPPLGLGFLSRYLRNAGFQVDLLDCNIRDISPQRLTEFIRPAEYRVIGLQAFDMDLPAVRAYLDVLRTAAPDTVLVVGGPAPSQNPAFVFRFLPAADYLVVGEGEEALEGLLRLPLRREGRPELDAVPNLAWRSDSDVHLTPHRYVEDLDRVGAPDWDALRPDLYSNSVHGFFYRRLPTLPILVSRGCPFRCSFCGSRAVTGYKVRRRAPAAVVEELADLKERYGLAEFQIVDDNFTAPPSAAREFAELLLRRRLDLLWTCPNGLRVDTLDRELLEAMKASGCYEVAVGIESGDPGILEAMGKKLRPEQVETQVRLIDSVGISVTGFVMVGYPGETEETLRRTMDFVLRLPLVRISLTRFIPMPGTPVTERLVREGELREEDLDPTRLHYGAFSYVPRGITEARLRSLYRTFFLRFLLRPRVIGHNLRSIRSISHAGIVFRKLLWFLR